MSGTRCRSLNEPDESMTFDHGRIDWVVIGDQTIGRSIQEPGWRWSTHIRPIVGGVCPFHGREATAGRPDRPTRLASIRECLPHG